MVERACFLEEMVRLTILVKDTGPQYLLCSYKKKNSLYCIVWVITNARSYF
jgi:hypothetical protein